MIDIQSFDAVPYLQTLPDNSVDCVVTSPPFFSVREYSNADTLWSEIFYRPMLGLPQIRIAEWYGELGSETDIDAYIGHLIYIFREVKRVLKPTGNFWVNMGDKYGRGNKPLNPEDNLRYDPKRDKVHNGKALGGGAVLKEKSLVLVPSRLALALDADDWYVRAECHWLKDSAMPESVKDRFVRDFEHWWHLSKRANYWFDLFSVAEPAHESKRLRTGGGNFSKKYADKQPEHGGESQRKPYVTRTKRTTFRVNSQASAYDYCRCGKLYLGKERSLICKTIEGKKVMLPCVKCGRNDNYIGHYAPYSRNLIEPIIMASCPSMCCEQCGKPYKRVLKDSDYHMDWGNERKRANAPGAEVSPTSVFRTGEIKIKIHSHWEKVCKCATNETVAGTVLDPFTGSGTTGMVAASLGLNFMGVDINPDYAALALARIERWREDSQFREENKTVKKENVKETFGSDKPLQLELF